MDKNNQPQDRKTQTNYDEMRKSGMNISSEFAESFINTKDQPE